MIKVNYQTTIFSGLSYVASLLNIYCAYVSSWYGDGYICLFIPLALLWLLFFKNVDKIVKNEIIFC